MKIASSVAFSAAISTISTSVYLLSAKAALACHDSVTPPTAGSPQCGGGGSASSVPEISATGSLAAIAAVAALGLLLWERRKSRST